MTKRVGSFILTFVKATVTQFFKIIRSKRKKPKQNCKSDTIAIATIILFKVFLTCKSTMTTVSTAMLLKFAFSLAKISSFSVLTES